MSTDKALVTDDLQGLIDHLWAVADDGKTPSGAAHLMRCAAEELTALAHPPAKREAGETAAPVQHVTGWENEEKVSVEEAWTILCETPDITSPEEYPDHALITIEQLGSFMARAISDDTLELLMAIENAARMAEQGVLSMDGGQAAVEIRSLVPARFRTPPPQSNVAVLEIAEAFAKSVFQHGAKAGDENARQVSELCRAALATTEGSDNG